MSHEGRVTHNCSVILSHRHYALSRHDACGRALRVRHDNEDADPIRRVGKLGQGGNEDSSYAQGEIGQASLPLRVSGLLYLIRK